ncbi:MAG: asparagine synthase (glutamine-hydrolyzing) [Thermoanaerobaculales bacterium]|jgi:asparagine synthase (glutamine-hydrolysing)|nr:asparagine synthase (glutamine-hydrolyzing) [Thermoanaerobaculales bacterium]
MCGIAGILGQTDRIERSRRVRAMTATLIHRGPDDEGFFDDESASLGFRRLSVIDLETGQQPIVLSDGRAAVVLNGEIYNFRELRAELQSKGHRFRSKGDAEVVLRLFAEEGIGCLLRLNGMFAIALWDARERVLHLARDRFGIKPLFWCRDGGETAFASELRALLAGGFPSARRLDRAELRHYLALGYPTPGGTLLDQVEAVPPGCRISLGADGRVETCQYWRPPEPDHRAPSLDDAAQRLRETLAAAVTRQLVADVPVGVFLSGGVDSSTVSAFAERAVSGPLRTFSVGFEGPGAVSELPAARVVAEHLGSDHHELVMDSATVARDLPAILDGLDTPNADCTAIPTWYMSRLARRSVTVALSGEGADEVFGGYERQRFDVAFDVLGGPGRRMVPLAMRLTGRRPSARLVERSRMAPGLARQLHWGRIFTAGEIDELAIDPMADEEAMLQPLADLAERWLGYQAADPVNGRLMTDREGFLPGDLLPKVDRMSMANSLEVRVPFLDNEVVDLVLPLPGRLKATLFRDKILLRRAVKGLIPTTAASRRKQAFATPIGPWLRSDLADAARELLSPDACRRRGLFDVGVVAAMLDEHMTGRRDHGTALWTLMVLEHWQRRLDDAPSGKAG